MNRCKNTKSIYIEYCLSMKAVLYEEMKDIYVIVNCVDEWIQNKSNFIVLIDNGINDNK